MTTDEKVPAWLTAEWTQGHLTAMREALDVNPDLKRQMVQFLFDTGLWNAAELTWDNAIARFNANLNPGRGTAFKLVEILVLCKRFERHALFLAWADDLGYEVRHKPTEERRQELLERLVTALERNAAMGNQAARELTALGGDGYRPAIEAAVRDRRASFDMPAGLTHAPVSF
jgi:hypothetical protein